MSYVREKPPSVQCIDPFGTRYGNITSAIQVFNSLVLDDKTRWYAEKLDENYWQTPKEYKTYMDTIGGKIMDFGTIRENILNGTYENGMHLINDMELVFDNAIKYNKNNTVWSKPAMRLKKILICLKNKDVIKEVAFIPRNDECKPCPKCNNLMAPCKGSNISARRCSKCAANWTMNESIFTCHNHTDQSHHFCSKCVNKRQKRCKLAKSNSNSQSLIIIEHKPIQQMPSLEMVIEKPTDTNNREQMRKKKRTFNPSLYNSAQPTVPPKKKQKLHQNGSNSSTNHLSDDEFFKKVQRQICKYFEDRFEQKVEERMKEMKNDWNAQRNAYDKRIQQLNHEKNQRLVASDKRDKEIEDLKKELNEEKIKSIKYEDMIKQLEQIKEKRLIVLNETEKEKNDLNDKLMQEKIKVITYENMIGRLHGEEDKHVKAMDNMKKDMKQLRAELDCKLLNDEKKEQVVKKLMEENAKLKDSAQEQNQNYSEETEKLKKKLEDKYNEKMKESLKEIEHECENYEYENMDLREANAKLKDLVQEQNKNYAEETEKLKRELESEYNEKIKKSLKEIEDKCNLETQHLKKDNTELLEEVDMQKTRQQRLNSKWGLEKKDLMEANNDLRKERDILIDRQKDIHSKMDALCESDDMKNDFDFGTADESIYNVFVESVNQIVDDDDDDLEDVVFQKIQKCQNYKKIYEKEVKRWNRERKEKNDRIDSLEEQIEQQKQKINQYTLQRDQIVISDSSDENDDDDDDVDFVDDDGNESDILI